jgi:hypothetical protein
VRLCKAEVLGLDLSFPSGWVTTIGDRGEGILNLVVDPSRLVSVFGMVEFWVGMMRFPGWGLRVLGGKFIW